MKRKIIVNLSSQYILSQVSEEDIFSKYICPVDYYNLVRNPMRTDKHPTAGFYINSSNRLIFHDFNGYFHGDCFAAMQKHLNLSFTECLYKIANDFNILKNPIGRDSSPSRYEIIRKQKVPTRIQVKVQKWTEVDKQYWKSYYLNSKILDKYHISSISHLWINDKLIYQYKDPAYVYSFGDGFYKVYFPFRDENRFITNTNNLIIQGYNQLPQTYDFLVITKSLKDICVYDLLGVPAIAPQAESNNLPESIIGMLKERFPIIISNYDFDYAGVKSANKIRKLYDIQPLFLTNGKMNTIDFGSKDIADYICKNGLEKTKELIKEVYNNFLF
jgi:hypothetical protein